MNAEFNWWLLIVGVVGGAGLLWLVLGDWSRREEEIDAEERSRESTWIAEVMGSEGQALDPATAEEILRLHRTYLRHSRRLDPLKLEELQARANEVAVDEPFELTGWPEPDSARHPAPQAVVERPNEFEPPARRNRLIED